MLDVMSRPTKPKAVRGRPRYYPFPEMEVGNTFTIPYDGQDSDKVHVRVRTSVLRWARANNRKFTVEKRSNGVFVQRIV